MERSLGGTTPKGELVAARILDAAIETIADHGVAGASLQRIADRAAVDKRVLGYYFGDRDGLFVAIVERVGDRLLGEIEETLGEVADPELGLEIGLGEFWNTVENNPRLYAAYFGLVAAAISNPVLKEPVAEIRERYNRLARERMDAAEAIGHVWPIDREKLLQLGMASLQGLALDFLQRGKTPELEAALEAFLSEVRPLTKSP